MPYFTKSVRTSLYVDIEDYLCGTCHIRSDLADAKVDHKTFVGDLEIEILDVVIEYFIKIENRTGAVLKAI